MRRQADTAYDLAIAPTQHPNCTERGAIFKPNGIQDLVITVDGNRGSAPLENLLAFFRNAMARRLVHAACHTYHMRFPLLRPICFGADEPKFDGGLVHRR